MYRHLFRVFSQQCTLHPNVLPRNSFKFVASGRYFTTPTEQGERVEGFGDAPSMSNDVDVENEYKTEIEDILKKRALKVETKQFLVGKVVSTKCKKSITVQVINRKYYYKYNGFCTFQRKVMAHDEEEIGKVGDFVRIVPCRPMSRRKRHKLFEILNKAGILE